MGKFVRRSDLVLAGAVGVVVLAGTVFSTGGFHTGDIKAYAMVVLGVAALTVRRRLPLFAVTLAGLSTAFYYVGPFPDGPEMLTFAVASFLAVAEGHRLAGYLGTAAGLAVFGSAEFAVGPPHVGRFVSVLAWVLVVLCAGEVVRYHRAWVGETRRRKGEAERTREEEFRRRATEERLRIAREVHDVLAHQISLINVQAGAALHRRDPDQAYAALAAIKDASKQTLRELRTTLGVLRQVDEAQPLSPAPSLGRIDDLISQTKDAGLSVRLVVSGHERDLPAPIDLAAYRIVQEALTNAVRHAGEATATVLVRYGPDQVVVEICDDGAGADVAEGNGIRGMRERAATLGGTLAAGPRPGGGFLVRASLPLTETV
ncbi:sensor histidine kinase [Actinoallomurus acaciae]|uniref:histidine kinase n=1 Tax=Actinoallomurus acaciae TaxID=502577 RepID=A0ABV5YE03_9ACTN